MNKRMSKKLYKKYMLDIVCDISQSSQWRKALFNLTQDQYLLICKDSEIALPAYIERYFRRHNLQYSVRTVEMCPESFDEGMIIFEFAPLLFPDIKHYSGNNPNVI